VESHLRKLFPHAVRFVWTSAVARGGSSLGQQPAAINTPHLDYFQNEPATRAFFQKHKLMVAEPSMILGELDGDDLELETLLGVWKPIRRSAPVTNHPLALMDASTFRPEHERRSEGSINFIVMTLHLLSSGILHHPDQRWFYYPDQTTSEALLFTQYTRGRHFANPHGARVG
ncbi:Uncharacterized protein (Fragment), partial [Durusdinium trenchii]